MILLGNICGYVGAFLIIIFLIPQLYLMFKKKSISDVSLLMIIMLSTASFGWITFSIYNLVNGDNSVIQILITNSSIAFSTLTMLVYKWYQYNRDKKIVYNLENNKYFYKDKNINTCTLNELLLIEAEILNESGRLK
ncbi:PQ-loop domain-containing transporter [Spiroplasma endosymbiont of Aspidapion aeneum]|uniref:PQ-loop domain-containing transporter n=1 Tax=Spiroplasma endosymbiont of Aspidapion aeneum TaxID=3066276 RepID=UPI00313CF060